MEPEPEIYYIDDTLNVPTLKWSKCSRSIASSTVESPTSPLSENYPDLPVDGPVYPDLPVDGPVSGPWEAVTPVNQGLPVATEPEKE